MGMGDAAQSEGRWEYLGEVGVGGGTNAPLPQFWRPL